MLRAPTGISARGVPLFLLFASAFLTAAAARPSNAQEGPVALPERAQLSVVSVSGNTEISTSRILGLVSSKPGEIADRYLIEEDVKAIVALYAERGYALATVAWTTAVDEQGRGALRFHVIEGPRCWVKHIRFEGNQALSDKELRSVMESKTRWLIPFLRPGYFDESVFVEEDLLALAGLYRSKGYLDAEVGGYYSHSDDFERITLNVVVSEGSLYKVSAISFQGNSLFRDDELAQAIPLAVGQAYSPQALEGSLDVITHMYRRQGHFDVSAGRNTLRARRTYLEPDVEVEFTIQEGRPVFIRRVNIEGLIKTKDEVVRRNLTVYPGERANIDKMSESERRLRNTGYFDLREPRPVEITLEPDEGVWRDAVVRVKEGPTGTIFFGGGFSTQSGAIGQIAFRERNFDIANWPTSWRSLFQGNALRGGGQQLSVSLMLGTERSDLSLSFRDPVVYIGDSEHSFGATIYALTTARENFDERRIGASVSLGKRLTTYTSTEVTASVQSIDIDDVDASAALEIQGDAGTYTKPFVEVSYGIDRRDNPFVPSEGYQARAALEVAGADIQTIKLTGHAERYWTAAELEGWGKHIFSLSGTASVLEGYGGRIPVFERLYAGGMGSLRGFDYAGVSPVDPATGDQVGGESLLTMSAQYSVPLISDDLRLAVFVDAGYVGEKAQDVFSGWDELRASTGVGLRWRIPGFAEAALAFDLAVPLKKEEFDDTRSFHFSIGGMHTF